ncbi:MAG: protease modulator HflC [Legionellales bacterium]|nr:protease modulator HflC [Legionellales bacterium]
MSRRFWLLGILVVAVFALTSSVFTVPEGKQALLFQFGHLKVNQKGVPVVLEPGLHIKLPFVAQARQFDIRAQALSLNVPVHMSKSGIDGNAEYEVYWKISELAQFYQSTGGAWQQADTLLSQLLTGHLNLTANLVDDNTLLLESASALTKELGITILAINYKGLALSTNALNTTYQIMRDAQEQDAKKLRMNGKLDADKIVSDAEGQSTIIIAELQANASKLRADGDAQAAKIYSNAYSKDPEFYSFLISLEAYVATFATKKDVLILTPDMQFFNYFNQPQAQPQTQLKSGQTH